MANAEINKGDVATPSISQSSLDYELNQTTPRSDGSLKTGKSTNSPNASKVLHCIPTCMHNRSETKQMLRCCIQMLRWHHFKCIKEDPKSTGIWTCYQCRKMPETIANMRHEIANLKQLTSPDILGSLLDIKTQISLLINEQKSLQTINADLMTRVNILTKEKDDLQERLLIAQSQSPQQKKSTNINSKTLLIGNSLLRNINVNVGPLIT